MLLVKKKKAEVNFSASSYSLKGIHGTCVHISLAKASPMVKLNVSWVERNIPTMERDRECFNKKYHLFCSLWAYCSCTSLWLWTSIQGCCKESIQTAFNAVPDLHFMFLLWRPTWASARLAQPYSDKRGMSQAWHMTRTWPHVCVTVTAATLSCTSAEPEVKSWAFGVGPPAPGP